MALNSIRRKVTTAPKEWFLWKEALWLVPVRTSAKGWWVDINSHNEWLVRHWPVSLCTAYSMTGFPRTSSLTTTLGMWVSVGQVLPGQGWLNCCASSGTSAPWKEWFLMACIFIFSLCLRSLQPNSRTTSSRQPSWKREMAGFETSRRPSSALKGARSLPGNPPGDLFAFQKPLT